MGVLYYELRFLSILGVQASSSCGSDGCSPARSALRYCAGESPVSFLNTRLKYSARWRARPFTKESLLYREIFEKYYPGQAEMIVDYWMPNKAWPNCAVNDPSARVLKNYGDSGK